MTPLEKTEFILEYCLSQLRDKSPEEVRKYPGTKFEGYLAELMRVVISQKPILDRVEVEEISGQRFPDIVLRFPDVPAIIGVEVKTTDADKWQTLGGSIFESTRVKGVEEVVLFFAKLGGEIDYRFKLHEDCAKDVLITHKPRYSIDMDIEKNETVFSKIGIGYEDVGKLKNPFKPFRKYLKDKFGASADLWWVEDDRAESVELEAAGEFVFKAWSELSKQDQKEKYAEACAFFPEAFVSKYKRVSTYLAARHKIVDHALRDRFSSGGTIKVTQDLKTFRKVPKVFKKLTDSEFLGMVKNCIESNESEVLADYWGKDLVSLEGDLFDIWVLEVDRELRSKHSDKEIPSPKKMIFDSLNNSD
ncbi:hypothetical protein ACH42_06980 [Endozoicomonas sp. (ex Bugula neritina AB1)]|nr:hypothetical protein ACH42_06980 [Endozoicomonas sp. (ex Bugula neritina AB1)]